MTNDMDLHLTVAFVALSVGSSYCAAAAQQAGSLPEQAANIEYASPQAAMAALTTKPGVMIKVENGWVVADDAVNKVVWSFPPMSSPASPAVVKRNVYLEGNVVKVRMDVMCGGTKLACDELVIEFQQLNTRLQEHLSHLPGRGPAASP